MAETIGVLTPPWGLPVAGEVLGQCFEAQIDTFRVRLLMPQPDNGGGRIGDLSAPQGMNDASINTWRQVEWGVSGPFSDPNSTAGSPPSRFIVRALGVAVQLSSDEPSLDLCRLDQATKTWLDTFGGWLSARRRDVKLNYPPTGAPLLFSRMVQAGERPVSMGSLLMGRPDPGGAAHLRDVEEAIRFANEEKEPPPAYGFLESAYECLMHDRRRSIIDSSTAAEMALSAFMARYLEDRGVKASERDVRMNQMKGLAQLSHSALLTGVELPGYFPSFGKILDGLAKPRNSAAHAGVSEGNAMRAISIAEAIVCAVEPLPTRDS